jgi:hypothetical protein
MRSVAARLWAADVERGQEPERLDQTKYYDVIT